MAKKKFTQSFQDIFSPTENQFTREDTEKKTEMADDETKRTTLMLSSKTYVTIKAIAYWQRKQIKDIIHEAVKAYLDSMDVDELKLAIESYEKDLKRALH